MAPSMSRKRKLGEGLKDRASRPAKKRKQLAYDSGSSSPSADEFDPVDLADSDDSGESVADGNPSSAKDMETIGSTTGVEADEAYSAETSESEEHSDAGVTTDDSEESESDRSSHAGLQKKTKRNDPAAFSNSLAAILSSKLTSSKRSDPVLARSKDAQLASHELAESKLELKARRKLREEKRVVSERGRVKDVLLGDRVPRALVVVEDDKLKQVDGISAQQIREQEQRLRKTAQRGVLKLFNAVRAAQVKGEEAAKEARANGVVGVKQREEKIGEMGRKAFLDLVGAGGEGIGA